MLVYEQLPEKIAIHWDSQGAVDGYAPKALAAFGLPVIMAVLNLLTHFFLNNDPTGSNAANVLRNLSKWLLPLLSVILMPITLFIALGYDIPVPIVASGLVGLIIIACGNYMPKCKRNYTVGIKLPWTLNSEENWNKTHHLAGYLWIISGLLIITGGCLGIFLPAILLTLLLLIVIPAVYSYRLYKKGI